MIIDEDLINALACMTHDVDSTRFYYVSICIEQNKSSDVE